ncbi:tyrosine-type recombinase/integrase, partial [Rhodovulum strictum]
GIVTMKLRGLSELGQGRWEYRRRVPEAVRTKIGKSEWKRVIKARSDADLLRQYGRVEAEFEREVLAAKAPKQRLTPRAAWEAAVREANEMAAGVVGLGDDDHDEARALVAESLVSLGRPDPLLVQALMDPRRSAPALTLEDARNVYVAEKLGGGMGAEHRAAMVRLERVMKLASEAGLPATTALSDLTREHARKVRDHMLSREKLGAKGERVSPASVKRELGLLRTVVSYGARELGLLDFASPFDKLPIEGLSAASGARVAAREKVDPLPAKIASAMRGKLTGDLRLIWRILEGTGCRLGEVTGLRVEDIVLAGDTPHLRIRWHEGRRLKTLSSIRSVPLVGDALAAAQEAVKLAEGERMLFPLYGHEGGPDAVSAALMKHLRELTKNRRHVVYSLRHNMKDLLVMAGVSERDEHRILGHSLGSVGNRVYGGDEAKLKAATEAMRKAIALAP